MSKTYNRIHFENYPSKKTAMDAATMNKMDKGIDDVDNKAAALEEKVAVESARLDNLVLNAGDSSAECADARVSEDGTTYESLKKRLDTEHSAFASLNLGTDDDGYVVQIIDEE